MTTSAKSERRSGRGIPVAVPLRPGESELELVARRGWLTGQVIALPHHAAEAFDWGERRFCALASPELESGA